jgi:hypothetical protein
MILDNLKKSQQKYRNSDKGKAARHASNLILSFGADAPIYYRVKLEEQNGTCAICGRAIAELLTGRAREPRHLSLDHDHKMNRRRGLLCRACNRGIGNFSDNATWLRNAAAYLERYQEIE